MGSVIAKRAAWQRLSIFGMQRLRFKVEEIRMQFQVHKHLLGCRPLGFNPSEGLFLRGVESKGS